MRWVGFEGCLLVGGGQKRGGWELKEQLGPLNGISRIEEVVLGQGRPESVVCVSGGGRVMGRRASFGKEPEQSWPQLPHV